MNLGEKPYKCHVCEKAFNQKGALQIHLTKHTGDKPYQCGFCPSMFSQKGNLRAHIQVSCHIILQNILTKVLNFICFFHQYKRFVISAFRDQAR